MMPVFEAVIFDLDGVIVDSEPLHERAFLEIFAELGYAANHGIAFRDYYGRSDRALWEDFIARHHPPQPLAELIVRKQDRLMEILAREQPIFPGVVELIRKLAPRYRLAVASGSPHPVIDLILSIQDIRRFFPVVVSVTDVGRSKPAPDVFLRAAELLGLAPGRCCVIEDAATGVESARSAGMEVIAITNSLPAEQLSRASRVVATYDEVAQILGVA
ncbi:MAG: HAD family phosphatase [Verrucomicrobiota bacterium]|jgi:HAD superfamily hydrolase (TIGR01509 family)